jgi:two-component system chemotaxis response regulator CheB
MADPNRLVVIGGSAGAVTALTELVGQLSEDIDAAFLIVLHFPSNATSALAKILDRQGRLPAVAARDGDKIEAGKILVAVPDHHLIVYRGEVGLTRGARENSHRPAVDPLFRTAARSYGPAVIGVVLSGVLDDGAAGMIAIKRMGGIGIVQDPADAMYDAMPMNAIRHAAVDHVLPVAQMGDRIAELADTPAPPMEVDVPPRMEMEARVAELDDGVLHGDDRPGSPSVYSCPSCAGTLWEIDEGDLMRFRCRVGHAWSSESLLAEKRDSLEAALWAAMRALEESASLSRRMGERADRHHNPLTRERFRVQAQDAARQADLIREVLASGLPVVANPSRSADAVRPAD